MGEPQRLVLNDVLDAHAEARPVADRLPDLLAGLRGDDDADIPHPRRRHRFDPVEQHRLVGDGHELLGARMGDRAQTRALAPRENQSLQRLHPPHTLATGSASKPSSGVRVVEREVGVGMFFF